MSKAEFEELYKDVLQNIEFGIIEAYRRHPEMTDWEVSAAVEALLRNYQGETKGSQTTLPILRPLSQEVYESARAICEWRLGREPLRSHEGKPVIVPMTPIALDEIVTCLRRIRKSINHWTREGGRQGYLNFVNQYIA
jgi:hypothetical protein